MENENFHYAVRAFGIPSKEIVWASVDDCFLILDFVHTSKNIIFDFHLIQ